MKNLQTIHKVLHDHAQSETGAALAPALARYQAFRARLIAGDAKANAKELGQIIGDMLLSL